MGFSAMHECSLRKDGQQGLKPAPIFSLRGPEGLLFHGC